MNTMLSDTFKVEAKDCKCGKVAIKMPCPPSGLKTDWYCECMKLGRAFETIHMFWKIANKKDKQRKGNKNEATGRK
jgi:hypothetical protein